MYADINGAGSNKSVYIMYSFRKENVKNFFTGLSEAWKAG